MEWNNKFTYPKSTRSIINGSRHYALDGSNLPSVTTILKVTQSEEDKAGLAAWKERVGHKEAERIKNEGDEVLNKVPKKKAKPPTKPPPNTNINKVERKSIAAIPKDS